MTPTPCPFKYLQLLVLSVALLAGCSSTAVRLNDVALPPSQLIETSDLADVTEAALRWSERLGNEQVLVVFDLDNTLLAMEQDLGADQWYDWQSALAAEYPCDERLVNDVLAVQGALYFASAMRPTQPDVADQVRALQDAGLKVFVLTSRGAAYRLQTFRELRRAGLKFHASAIGPPGGYPETFVPAGGKRPALYEDGVFLTAGQHKGVMLRALLDKTGTATPAMIIMVDDKLYNLQNVLDSFADSPVTVQAWRYTREDAAVERFDAAEADNQWRALSPLLLEMQDLLGPDHYDLPDQSLPVECEATGE